VRNLDDFAGIASDWFWETDAEHRFTYFSARMEEVTRMRASATVVPAMTLPQNGNHGIVCRGLIRPLRPRTKNWNICAASWNLPLLKIHSPDCQIAAPLMAVLQMCCHRRLTTLP